MEKHCREGDLPAEAAPNTTSERKAHAVIGGKVLTILVDAMRPNR